MLRDIRFSSFPSRKEQKVTRSVCLCLLLFYSFALIICLLFSVFFPFSLLLVRLLLISKRHNISRKKCWLGLISPTFMLHKFLVGITSTYQPTNAHIISHKNTLKHSDMFRSCLIIIRELCSLLKLYYSIHNPIRICKRGVVAAYHVVEQLARCAS